MGILEIAGLSIIALVAFGGLAARALEQVNRPTPRFLRPSTILLFALRRLYLEAANARG